jgi:hypothetical protein
LTKRKLELGQSIAERLSAASGIKYSPAYAWVFLVACASTPEGKNCITATPRMSSERWDCLKHARKESEKREQNEVIVSRINKLKERCAAYGYLSSSEEFSKCLERLDTEAINQQNAPAKPTAIQCYRDGNSTICYGQNYYRTCVHDGGSNSLMCY